MRTVSGLFPTLCDAAHLERAAALTVRGKRGRPDIAWFLFRQEAALAGIGAALEDGSWRPSGFAIMQVRDPKPRAIARAPVEDRVVHAAVATLLEPVLLRSAIPEAFACVGGGGAHRAVIRLTSLMRRHRFVVHLDVRSFFPSVDLDLLHGLLGTKTRDSRFLEVLGHILDSGAKVYRSSRVRRFVGLTKDWPPPGRGLPIGAYTSQVLATHLYLVGLDHHVKRRLHVPGYVRYVDDLFLFGDRREDLRRWREGVGVWLAAERHLLLKHPEAPVLRCAGHLDALGYRIRRDGWTALPRALRRMRRRVATWTSGRTGRTSQDPRASLASTSGVVLF